MCGFAGLVSSAPITMQGVLNPEIAGGLDKANLALRHRGPDSQASWSSPQCALTHVRLRVIGGADHGKQPISDTSERYVAVYNGAIYNFRDLARMIGYVEDCPESDTRILIEGFSKFGPAFIRKLNGMFALAIWDKQENRLYLARDSFGQKPLYYGQEKGRFVFGSLPRALFPLLTSSPQADPSALHHYLSLGYVPAPHSGFKHIHKLLPGSILQIGLTANGFTEPSIASFTPETAAPDISGNPKENSDILLDKLETAVKRCLIADVPLGGFLSGGVDSSAIVAIMCRLSSRQVQTFSVGFSDQAFDETPYARQVANHLGTDHHEFIFDKNIANFAGTLANHYDEPYGDSSAIPTFALSELTKKHVTVALSGDGADELFLGYPRYPEMIRQERLSRIPAAVANAAAFAGKLPALWRLKHLKAKVGAQGEALYFPTVSHFSDAMKQAGYNELMRDHLSVSTQSLFSTGFSQHSSMIDGAAHADQDYYLPDDLMTKTDRASMAHALEVRAPYLDTELSHWARNLPWEQKYFDQTLKALLKQSVKPLLPEEILARPKQGFAVPLASWLSGPLKDRTKELLLAPTSFCKTLFKPAYIDNMVEAHMSGAANHDQRLWLLFMLETWARRWDLA